MTLEHLNTKLAEVGMALSNLPTSSSETLGGLIVNPSTLTFLGVLSVGTHGSSSTKGILSTDVLALQIILADCTKITCSAKEHPDLFHAALCSLGTATDSSGLRQ